MRVAVIGAGPAGLAFSDRLKTIKRDAQIDIFEKSTIKLDRQIFSKESFNKKVNTSFEELQTNLHYYQHMPLLKRPLPLLSYPEVSRQ